jgi:hypothetical protein
MIPQSLTRFRNQLVRLLRLPKLHDAFGVAEGIHNTDDQNAHEGNAVFRKVGGNGASVEDSRGKSHGDRRHGP